uniref:RNA-binding region-containing protein 3 n=1 Tax=Magallana gigas TaxID=29159 RepID=A0A8W8MTQ9_MAGGI
MGTNQEPNCTLYVRHLPSELNKSEKEDLLTHFGASRVKVMGNKGPMRHAAFASYPDNESAKKALTQLHQLEVLGCKLVVEFAKNAQSENFPSQLEKTRKKTADGRGVLQETKEENVDEYLPIENTFKTWRMEYPRNPKLHYLYPPPEEELRESDLPYTVDPSKFLSLDDLKNGKISKSEMKNFSVFKNYKNGEIASRLYIKNLAKQTTEQDLVNIYGSFVNWDKELEKNIFDIRLMKEGRMKGQAFVTFSNETSANKALKETNGFVLNSKPMAVQFARSAKAKETNEKSTKK